MLSGRMLCMALIAVGGRCEPKRASARGFGGFVWAGAYAEKAVAIESRAASTAMARKTIGTVMGLGRRPVPGETIGSSRELLGALFKSSTVGVAICDRHLRFCAVNDALAQVGAPEIEMPASPEKVWRALQAR